MGNQRGTELLALVGAIFCGACTPFNVATDAGKDGSAIEVAAPAAAAIDATDVPASSATDAEKPAQTGADAGGCRTNADCPGESCVSGSYSAAGTCDVSGMCKVIPPSPCGNYACTHDNRRCWSTCGTDQECASSAYCSADRCEAKLPSSKLCTRNGECASGDCQGRCCGVGVPCKCTQPNRMNLFINPGMDGDISAWNALLGTWNAADVEGCPFSGSLSSSDDQSLMNGIAQCVPVPGNKAYNFGGWFKGDTANLSCFVSFMDSPNCEGALLSRLELKGRPASSSSIWTEFSESGFVASEVKSGQFVCYASRTLVDQLYLSPAPLTF